MASVFLNYRREDSSGYAGRIFDGLAATFGKQQIFRDVDRIEPGLDFTEVIDQSLKSCVALLVLIGPRWLELRNEAGELRLHEPVDYVRFEIEGALQRGVRVIPVLVPGMRHVPTAEELPESISKLSRHHVFRLTEESWDAELKKLTELLIKLGLEPLKPEPPPPPPPTQRNWISYVLMTLGVLFIIGTIVQFTGGGGDDPPAINGGGESVNNGPVINDDQGPQTRPEPPPQEREVAGSRSNIMRLQRGLAALGYYQGTVDGISGPRTSSALRAYQSDEGLRVDGRLTASLLAVMDEVSGPDLQTTQRNPAPGISVAGLWYTNEGARVVVEQNGNRFSATSYDALGNVYGTSEGRIDGIQVSYTYRLSDGTTGQGQGTMQPDNQHINISEKAHGALFPESDQLHRGHLPSSGY